MKVPRNIASLPDTVESFILFTSSHHESVWTCDTLFVNCLREVKKIKILTMKLKNFIKCIPSLSNIFYEFLKSTADS